MAAFDGGETSAVAPRSAPLVVARAILGAGAPLRSSVASVPDDPLPVVARLAAGAAAVPRGPIPSRVSAAPGARGPSAASPVALGRPAASGAQAPGSAFAPAIVASAGPVQRTVVGGPPGAPSTSATPSAPLVLSRPTSSRDAAAGADRGTGMSGEAAAAPPIPVARLADGGASPAARVLGWTPAAGFAAMSAPEGPVVQRAVQIGEMTSEVAPPPAGGADGGAAGGQDYEEIAERVYDRIRSRFATELLLDRERMGLLIDG